MMRNTKEIDTILIELNKSIDAHYKWLVTMFRAWCLQMLHSRILWVKTRIVFVDLDSGLIINRGTMRMIVVT